MVQPGTFHVVDAIPGSYDVTVIFSDGTHVEINDGYSIPQQPVNTITEIDINGGSITGDLIDQLGNPLMVSIILRTDSSNASDAISDCNVVKYAPCLISPELSWNGDELIGSKLTYGPIMPGAYIVEIDMDSDGFSEIYMEYIFDANETSSFVLPSPIPNTTDLTFQLVRDENGMDTLVNDLNLTLNLKNGTGSPVNAEYNTINNDYYVELLPGTWILNYTLSDTEQLWEEIEIANDDFSAVYEFHTSQVVNGTLYYNENISDNSIDEDKILDFVPIVFYWDDFSTTVETSFNGTFSLVLPEGAVVDAIAQLGVDLKLVNGTQFVVDPGMDEINMVARPGQSITGAISINRANNLYNFEIGGWESVTAIAESLDYDVKWRAQVNEGGTFDMVLPKGNWQFSVDSDEFISGTNITNVDNNNNTIEILIYPDNSLLSVDFFLDNSGDNNLSNGTPVSYDFSLISLIGGLDYLINVDGSEWNGTGHAEVPVEPGIYRISVEISHADSGDEFGTRIMTGEVDFRVGMDSSTIHRSIGFDPEWRVSMSFTNESGGVLSDQLVRLTNIENGWILSRTTDINGSIVDFISQGDWIVTTDIITNGIREGLRNLISVSSDNAIIDLQMATSELAEVSFNLSEDVSNDSMSGISLALESADGLGSFSIVATDSNGFTSTNLVPGDWIVSLNYTEEGKRWLVDDYLIAIEVGSDNHYNLTAILYVALTGTVFWDLNDNNASNVAEGISDVNMAFSNANLSSIILDSGENGDWELFVPANTIWQINTSYDGFESIQLNVSLSNVPNSVLLELTAGLVNVSGNLSYDLGISSIPVDDIVLTIIPTEGLVRDTVTPEIHSEDGVWSGSWSAELEPGLWIVSASVPNQDLVVMGLLNVDVVNGGNLDMELTRGGLLDVNTEWLDYDGVSHNIGDMDANVIINLGYGIKWVQEVNDDGSLSLLLPDGNVQFSSDFEVEQRGLVMEYVAGRGADVYSGQESPVLTLLYNRISNHDITIQTLNLTSGDDSYIGSLDDVNLVVNGTDGFTPVEFILGIEYLGHESYDLYTVGGTVSGSDSADWTLQFDNGSGEWNTSTQFEVGLDNSQIFDNLNIRVIPANQSLAHAFEEGHQITILISTQDGYQDTHSLTVRVPQLHGFELTNPMDDVYGVSPGELIIVPIEFTNAGNGDEKFEFEFDDTELPEGWSRTGPTSHTLGGFVSTTHSVTVVSPEDTPFNDKFSIYVTVTDKVDNSYETIVINIQSSEPILKVEGVQALGGGEPESGGMITYIATISNQGLVEAKKVQLNATLCNDVSCESPTSVSATTIMDISAESEMQFSFLFDLSDITVGPYYLVLDINASIFGEENINDDSWHNVDDIQIGSKNIDVRSPAAGDDENTDIIAPLLVVGLIAIGLYLTKGRSRRPGAPF